MIDTTDEIVQQIGPVTIRRLDSDSIIIGVHMDRPDGAAAHLDPDECRQIAQAIADVTKERQNPKPKMPPFHDELVRRCEEASGLKFKPHTHSGIVHWLARQIDVSEMSASRYLHGKALPLPRIARKIAELLEWNRQELVAAMIEHEIGGTLRHIVKKYHAEMP